MILALLLLVAGPADRVPLVEETIVVPAKDWRAIDFTLKQSPAVVECNFKVLRGKAGVRLMLVGRESLEGIEGGEPARPVATTLLEHSGTMRVRPPDLGEYALVIDNREGERGVEVKLDVWLDFGAASIRPVTTLSRGRRMAIVALTLVLFAGLVVYAGRRLHQAMRSRQ